MMKIFITILCFFAVSSAYAGSYIYKCQSIDQNPFFNYKMVLHIANDMVILTMPDELYESYPTKDIYQMPHRPDFVSVHLSGKDKNVETQFNITPLIIEKILFNGGKRLRRGDLGGFVKFVAQGYSYENYLCILQK
ncbi:MAG: hypothetical protein KF802_07545 [Bdellovibrionaceae bacterium]|nr:hypothetical protein [Pseudobdellovibrionaceae bacterium]MBX3032974.1 hypothetical protein [Pseudobdellovibrionaceae bacterium]